jgi:hypothetical protein
MDATEEEALESSEMSSLVRDERFGGQVGKGQVLEKRNELESFGKNNYLDS